MTATPSGTGSDRLTSHVYQLLWILGLLSAAFSFIELQQARLLSISSLIALILGLAMLAQQVIVYVDLHSIEDDASSSADDYPLWLNSPQERIVRLLILFCLLFAVGKIAYATLPLVQHIQCQEPKEALLRFFDRGSHGRGARSAFFVNGSLALFLLLCLWNLCALHYRSKARKLGGCDHGDEAGGKKILWSVVTIRVTAFALLSLVAFVYWLMVRMESDLTGNFAEIFFIPYAVTTGVALLLRHKSARDRVVTWLESRAAQGAGQGNAGDGAGT